MTAKEIVKIAKLEQQMIDVKDDMKEDVAEINCKDQR